MHHGVSVLYPKTGFMEHDTFGRELIGEVDCLATCGAALCVYHGPGCTRPLGAFLGLGACGGRLCEYVLLLWFGCFLPQL